MTDSLGRVTSWEYDALGRVITSVLPDTDGAGGADPPELATSYDLMGRVLTETDALGNVTAFEYDNLGRLIERTEADPDGAGGVDAPVTSFSYDGVGNMLSLTDPAGNVTTWVYDYLYRVTSETNELTDTRSWQYDAVGNVVESTDRLGRVREFDFDGLNRLIEERWLDGETLVNTIEFGWDVASQLGVAEDEFSGYAYTYDGLGRVTQIDNAATPDAPNVVLVNGYDVLSRRTSQTANIDATDDYENTYTFDALSRLTRIEQTEQTGGNSVGDKRVDLAYNAVGQISQIDRYEDLTATDLVATSTFGYDSAGRLTSLDHDQGANALAAYTWTYDVASRITQFTSSTDGTTDYTYDDTHQLIDADHSYQTDESFAWDENGNPTGTGYTIGDDNRLLSDGTYNYEYDAEGNRTKRTEISGGTYEDYEWDHRNRLTAVEQRNSSDALQWRVEYTYDVFDRLIARAADTDGDSTIDEVQRFVYDQFVKGGLDDIVLVFDASDNLTERLLHGPAVDQVFASEDAMGEILWHLGDNQNTVRDVADYDATLDETTIVNHRTFDSFGELISESGTTTALPLAFQGRYRDPLTGLQNHRARWYDAIALRWTRIDPIGFLGGDTNFARFVFNSPTAFVDPSGNSARANDDQTAAEEDAQEREEILAWVEGRPNAERYLGDILEVMRQAHRARLRDLHGVSPDGNGSGPCYWCRWRFERIYQSYLEQIAMPRLQSRGIDNPTNRRLEMEAALVRSQLTETTGIQISTIEWDIHPNATGIFGTGIGGVAATAHTAVVVTITPPGQIEPTGTFYFDAGVFGETQGNLGGTNGIFFQSQIDTDIYLRPGERERIQLHMRMRRALSHPTGLSVFP